MTRILVVDDSALVRRVLGEILREGDFEVEFARDGVEAMERLHAFKPDVVTLDVEMPGMDGLEVLDRIMVERPCPVVMVSSLTSEGAETTLTALELGAVDFVPKPGGVLSLSADELAPRLIDTVALAAKARVRSSLRLVERLRARRTTGAAGARKRTSVTRSTSSASGAPSGLVVIGTSTGGPAALDVVLSDLPETFPWPVLVAQHMPASFTGSLAARLDGLCALSVVEVTAPTLIETGVVYVARGDADMIVSRRSEGLVVLPAPSSAKHRWHPSVDRLMVSAMDHLAADRLAGVLMTGMGNDGAGAMAALRAAGGRTIAESEASAVVWGMPGELVRADGADFVEDLDDIAGRLIQMLMR
ncbi:chemotaxis-specific protein-glutamate methyltransferase CheB [Caulobacter endophyticus]|uniref:Protein-glutamate methylesterase/protein-glutamine glutaminase n=1 Tax=Caulobacter endophyticus TaxID=2172652 RepID=A0A2T9JGV3_9CAUL|nr:chemotaxis-specific protein-glutamate methyltransferase CheB [Caulobacter endophyticus]PVM82934.1 chemotaxis response regulator protein-glutamate methylesterase [Caulobacter endophyticus]